MTAADDALQHLAATPRLLVALDFDGTLSPFVTEPMDARMLGVARDAVDALAAAPGTTVALVSGRALPDLRIIAEHDDDSPILLAGSHGVEYWLPQRGRVVPDVDADHAATRAAVIAAAEERLADLPGIRIEPKSFGMAVHSRGADDRAADDSVRIADEVVGELAPDWRRRLGHSVVEYSFRDEGKDAAIAVLRAETEPTAVLFAGDDVTDEDAIAALEPGDVGVRLGAGDSAAQVRMPGIPEFAAWLAELAYRRSESPPAARPPGVGGRE
ncbi:trehalose phosphatase [Microbacterium mangrovi]|uniref:Trehalose 6-phosphate phosphatase n=1 Tax=Microbacterium mangrovi TaxID=1348253 RepID=A0A0B2A2Z7_9MICO|nr:trehalose-phosphatase [Microbacterium mangrovi]KHK97415.1 trehalose phosphatase [Microbacterium mangrovi]